MKRNDPEVPARYYVRMGEVLAARGVDVLALLRAVRLKPEAMALPEAKLRWSQVEALVAQVLAMPGLADLALDVGRVLKPSSHASVGFAMLSSPDIDYALRVLARYFRLVMPSFRMHYRAGGGRTEIRYAPAFPQSHACLAFHLEAIAAATYWEIKMLSSGEMPAGQLHFSVPPPLHVARYAELGGAQCHFGSIGSPGVRLLFDADFTRHSLPMADAGALKMAEARCAELLRNVVAVGQVRDWVAMMLRESADGWPTLGELAQTLNLSPRTLDRYLKREGASFRILALQVRHERACELLRRGLSVTQIAHELGYTDASNFTRAFRRAAGRAPSLHRPR